MSEGARKRKRNSLREMADYAFDRALELRRRNRDLAEKGVHGYPRASDLREAAMLEDICFFTDTIRGISPELKDEIRRQLAEATPRENPAGNGQKT